MSSTKKYIFLGYISESLIWTTIGNPPKHLTAPGPAALPSPPPFFANMRSKSPDYNSFILDPAAVLLQYGGGGFGKSK